jgi:hypothetical protein
MRNLFLASLLFFTALLTYAQKPFSDKDITYKIAPLFGFETVYRTSPTPHTSTHMMYGARATIGVDRISGELEVTRGTDTENYTVAPQKVSYIDDKLKLGIRSQIRLGTYFNVAARLGGQATRTTIESTRDNVLTVAIEPIEYSPYAGAAFGIDVGIIGVHIGTTAVFKDVNDMSKNEYQNSISISAGMK